MLPKAAENEEHFSARYTVAESADYFLVRERFVRKKFFHQIVVRFRNGFDKRLTKHIYFFSCNDAGMSIISTLLLTILFPFISTMST